MYVQRSVNPAVKEVPGMLSLITMAEVAANSRDRSGMGALPACSGETVLRDRALAMAAACPQASTAAVHYGSGTTAAGPAELTRQQRTSRRYAHTTRIAAFGGAMGPHPARDPV